MFLFFFIACNPEHNPTDLTVIQDILDERDAARTTLAESKRALKSSQDQVQLLQDELEGYKVVATHYANEHKFAGNSLVVCHDLNGGDFSKVTFTGILRPAWIQATVNQECSEPWHLIYGPAPVVEPVATVATDGTGMEMAF